MTQIVFNDSDGIKTVKKIVEFDPRTRDMWLKLGVAFNECKDPDE